MFYNGRRFFSGVSASGQTGAGFRTGLRTGAISLLLAARGAATVVGIDRNPHVVQLMRRSIAANKLEDRVSAEVADLRELKKLYRSESFDLIAANPPYRNSGKVRQVATAACHEVTATLEDFFQTAAYLVKYRGRFACAVARTVYGMYGTGPEIWLAAEKAAMGTFFCR